MSAEGGPDPPGSGRFIVFEGGDGAGKSTQVARLARWLEQSGRRVVATCEPGGTDLGRQLRSWLLDPRRAIGPRAELLLYAADRAQHVAEVIRPALAAGAIVVSDRFVDSTIAYQGGGRALTAAEVARFARWAADGAVPDLTVLLDVAPSVGARRRSAAADRMEAEDGEFHARVRQRFLDLAGRRPRRYLVLDATAPADEIASLVCERVSRMLAAAGRQRPAGSLSAGAPW